MWEVLYVYAGVLLMRDVSAKPSIPSRRDEVIINKQSYRVADRIWEPDVDPLTDNVGRVTIILSNRA